MRADLCGWIALRARPSPGSVRLLPRGVRGLGRLGGTVGHEPRLDGVACGLPGLVFENCAELNLVGLRHVEIDQLEDVEKPEVGDSC